MIFFIECFTTTFLRAHSWLNWVDEDDDEDEVGLKEKPEDTRYISAADSDQCRCIKPESTYGGGGGGGRGLNVLVGSRLQLGLRFWFPPDPRRRCCSTFLNLNWWKGYCYHKILIMVPRVGDGDPSFPVHPGGGGGLGGP